VLRLPANRYTSDHTRYVEEVLTGDRVAYGWCRTCTVWYILKSFCEGGWWVKRGG
jgi:hypothetical protein